MKHRTPTRIALAALAASALAVSLAACAAGTDTSGAEETGPVTITFWDNNGGSDRSPVYQDLIKQFEAQNENITVEYVGIPAADHVNKFQTAVAGGTPPDVGIVNNILASSLAAQGALVPLEDLLAKSDLNGKIAEDALTTARGSVPDGKLYILPHTSTAGVLWYRSDWFKDAGLKAPEKWSDFFDDAKTVTDAASGRYGFVVRGGVGSVAQLTEFVVSCSGITSYFDKKGVSTIDSPDVVDCIQQFADLYGVATSQADLAYGYQEMVTAFDSGKAAMLLHNLGSTKNHLDALGEGVVLAAPLPLSDATGKRTLQAPSTEGPAVFSGSKHQDAAWKFSQFLLSHEANSLWNEKAGQIPTNLDARKDQWVADSQALSTATEALGADDTTVVVSPAYLPDWSSILSGLEPDFQSVLMKETSAADFAKKWAQQLTDAEADYRANFPG